MKVDSSFSLIDRRSTKRKNNPLLPRNVRGLIIGKSNCGKTTLMLNLLLQDNWLDYNRLYVFGRTLHQMEYQLIRAGFEKRMSKTQIGNVFKHQNELDSGESPIDVIRGYNGPSYGDIKADFFEDCTAIPDPAELDPKEKNLLILDDCFLGPQSKAEAYYTRGRQNNCDTFYISQSYFRLPRHSIRENSNFIILFKQDAKNISHIYMDHCEGDMPLTEFKEFCRRVWTSSPHQFITLDLSGDTPHAKYRENLDVIYTPKKETQHVIRSSKKQGGSIIEYLPSDIKTLRKDLTYLQGEYEAGNTSTSIRNKIVSIADTLLDRGAISELAYRDINNRIQNEIGDTYDGQDRSRRSR